MSCMTLVSGKLDCVSKSRLGLSGRRPDSYKIPLDLSSENDPPYDSSLQGRVGVGFLVLLCAVWTSL